MLIRDPSGATGWRLFRKIVIGGAVTWILGMVFLFTTNGGDGMTYWEKIGLPIIAWLAAVFGFFSTRAGLGMWWWLLWWWWW